MKHSHAKTAVLNLPIQMNIFFYNSDSHEIVDFVHLFSIVGISDGSKIKGAIIESYCSHCNKFI